MASRVMCVVGIVIWLAGCGPKPTQATQHIVPPASDLARLQSDADEACICEQKATAIADRRACWRDFEAQSAHYGGMPSAFATVYSVELMCFGEEQQVCVRTKTTLGEATLCGAEQAQTACRIFAWANAGSVSPEGVAAAERTMAALAAGRPTPLPSDIPAHCRDGPSG